MINNRTCPECGSVDVRPRGSGVNSRAEKPVWCQNCKHTCELMDLGEPKEKDEIDKTGNLLSGLAKKLNDMDKNEI